MMVFGRVLSLLRRWRRSGAPAEPDPDDPSLVTVVRAFDDAEAASAVLARSPEWIEAAPAVLRHHLQLPEESVEHASELLKQDGWRLRRAERAELPAEAAACAAGTVALIAERIQKLDPLHCSQETSRMAGLAQRHGGRSFGWDALQPG